MEIFYLYLAVVIVVGTLLVVPYVYGTLQLFSAKQKWGIDHLVGSNDNDLSRRHLLYIISKAVHSCDICTGSLRADVWGKVVADAIERRLHKHPKLRVRILSGPVLDGFVDGTHPSFEKLKALQELHYSIEFRALNRYPEKGQGRHADGNLYVELVDHRDAAHRRFVAFYKDYMPDQARVDAWIQSFVSFWDNRNIQLVGLPPVEPTVALETEPNAENATERQVSNADE